MSLKPDFGEIMESRELPETYADLKVQMEDQFSFHNRVVNMAIEIRRSKEGKVIAFLGGYLPGKESEFLKCETNRHNWLLSEGTIFPLPNDAPLVFERVFLDIDCCNLSDRNLFELKKNQDSDIKIFFHDNLNNTANAQLQNKPNGLNADLYPYQVTGWNYLSKFLEINRGIILADEMGLGKTLQAIAWICSIDVSHNKPILIICPSSLLQNWTREIERFGPELRFRVHHGAYRTGVFSELLGVDVVISTYDTVGIDNSLFTAIHWRALLCDEAQALKTPSSNRRKRVAEIGAQNFIAITGTPVENSLTDLWSIMDLAEPNMLGSLDSFMENFPDSEESGNRLSSEVKPFLLRRSVKEVADDLPDRIDVDIPLTMNSVDAREYIQILEETKAEYPNAAGLVATIRLQIFCTHPMLRSSGNSESDFESAPLVSHQHLDFATPKLDIAIRIIKEAFNSGEKVLVFSQFNGVAEIFARATLQDQDFYFGAINGATEVSERQNIIDEFSEYEGNGLLVLNPRAAGVGLNITAANVVVHFSPLWNPALEDQASARSYRRGQEKPVRIYHLFYEKTVEEVMVERLRWKRSVGAEIAPTSSRDAEDLSRSLKIHPEEIF